VSQGGLDEPIINVTKRFTSLLLLRQIVTLLVLDEERLGFCLLGFCALGPNVSCVNLCADKLLTLNLSGPLNGTAHIRHRWRKTTVNLPQLINTGGLKMNI
jgi:hypothetical protein